MKIAFDLDSTLIPCGVQFPTERPFLLLRLIFPERLRKGSQKLIKTLQQEGHEIWIYTTSQRPAWQLKMWRNACTSKRRANADSL